VKSKNGGANWDSTIRETPMAKPITNEQQALAAVRQDGWKLEYVPQPLRDEVLRALKSGA
jgi:hypothetical protein